GDAAAIRTRLDDPSPAVRRGALIALDEMHGGALTASEVIPMLDPSQPDLRRAALAVVTGHAEWAASMAKTLRHWLVEAPKSLSDPGRLDGVRRQLLAFAGDPSVRSVI